MISLASIVAAVFAVFYAFWLFGLRPISAAVAVLAVLIILRHRENIARMLRGAEPRVGEKPRAPSGSQGGG
jgi:glycerol-3-phosphate acyltransferase PlsY